VGVEGFPVVDGRDVLIADTAQAFAGQVSTLLENPRQRIELGEQGLQFSQNYDWRVVVPRFLTIYDSHLAEK